VTQSVNLVWSHEWLTHAPEAYPESPERLHWAIAGTLSALDSGQPGGDCRLGPADAGAGPVVHEPDDPLSLDELALVHSRRYLRYLEDFTAAGGGMLTLDTEVSEQSMTVARLAAAGADLGCRLAVANGRPSLVLTRPPGHHAFAATGSGFCLINNAAVAARLFQQRGGGRVAIVDWDVHHGNGTQDIFLADPGVLYVSIHESPHYPFSGWLADNGEGPGRGTTVNVPLPGGLGDAGAVAAFDRVVVPCVREFAPELLIVSAGQDGHYTDPLSSWRLTARGYGQLAAMVRETAAEVGAALCLVLEGGYTQSGMALSMAAVTAAWAGCRPPEAVLTDGNQLQQPSSWQQQELSRQLGEIVRFHASTWPLA